MRTKLLLASIAIAATSIAFGDLAGAERNSPPVPMGNCYDKGDGNMVCYLNGSRCFYKDGKKLYCLSR